MDLEIIITIIIFFAIFSYIAKNLIKFEKTLELKKRQKGEIKNRSIFTQFVIRNTIIAGSLAFVIGLKTRDLIQSLLDAIINPFFKDKKRIRKVTNVFKFTILGMKFCFSDFLLDLIKYLIFLLISYLIVITVYLKTDLIYLQDEEEEEEERERLRELKRKKLKTCNSEKTFFNN